MKPKIIVVIPTVRPEQYKLFLESWKTLFLKHSVILITVWDGETPHVSLYNYGKGEPEEVEYAQTLYSTHKGLIFRYTDACRNLGFIVAAHLMDSPYDVLITLDDDVAPLDSKDVCISTEKLDPIQSHIDILQKKVPISWMNTADSDSPYLRGVPYGIRDEAPVMLSHGVWYGTPDFDGETQLNLEKLKGVPYYLPFFHGPVPKEVLFPCCGMNLAIRRDALPYLYFAPMGPDTRIDGLNRFADIWMGVSLKKEFDKACWACYTGGSIVLHTRASDANKNFEQEKLGREWNEDIEDHLNTSSWCTPGQRTNYFHMYSEKRYEYKRLIKDILQNNFVGRMG